MCIQTSGHITEGKAKTGLRRAMFRLQRRVRLTANTLLDYIKFYYMIQYIQTRLRKASDVLPCSKP